jgi:hypothetical protein
MVWTVAISIIVLAATLVFLAAGIFPAGWVAANVAPFALLAAATTVGFGASGGVARERQKNTLTDLFMLPGSRRDILRAKLAGAAWAGRWFLLAVAGLLVVAPFGGTPLVAVPFLALATVAFLAFAATLGIWMSVRSRTALTAHASWMGFTALSLIGTYLVADAASVRVPTTTVGSAGRVLAREFPEWSRIVNPVMAWEELAMTPNDEDRGFNGFRIPRMRLVPDEPPRLRAPLIGVAIYALLAGALWWAAVRRFEREGREE